MELKLFDDEILKIGKRYSYLNFIISRIQTHLRQLVYGLYGMFEMSTYFS